MLAIHVIILFVVLARNVNIFCLHTFDVALGVTAMMWLSRESRTETLALVTMDWADVSADSRE